LFATRCNRAAAMAYLGRIDVINKFPDLIVKLIKGEVYHSEYFSVFKFLLENYSIKYFWIVCFKTMKRKFKLQIEKLSNL
jgi:hypothetical protein